jgi:FRG domain
METIGSQKIWSFFDTQRTCLVAKNTEIRKGPGHRISAYFELATKVAELQFRNRDHVLLFRGQSDDHRNAQGNTALKPTLLRPERAGNPPAATLIERFERLERAERELVDRYAASGFLGVDRLRRHRILRWSILQHYEICKTPLLDVTHSLRIAASFASLAEPSRAYLFVLGVPNLSGAVTASAEAGLQIVRLSSVCPPSAARPHIQEGYLLGVYPDLVDYAQRENYGHYEMDFGRRLVAKFVFNPATFWKNDTFPKVRRRALYPSAAEDALYKLMLSVQRALG